MSGYIGNIPVPQATQTRNEFTATAGQTTFATSGYTAGFVDVHLNGVKLSSADFTATNGSDIVLVAPASADDVVEVLAFTTFEVENLADVASSGDYNDLVNTPAPFDPNTLATVATTGDYNDLTNKPAADITEVIAGSGISGGGISGAVTVNHADTSSQASVNNSGSTVIQDITLDTYGHITNINSTTISAGASTTFNAVGTYCLAVPTANANRSGGQTRAGSGLRRANTYTGNGSQVGASGSSLSGSWRVMGQTGYYNFSSSGGSKNVQGTLWVRYA